MAKSTSGTKSLQSKGSPVFLLTVVGIAVVGLAVIAFAATRDRGSGASDSAASAAPVEIVGDALPQRGDGDKDPAVGLEIPELSGTDLDGAPLKIEADGKPKAIYFVAHWCPHCQDEVPVVQDLIDEDKQPESLDIYAVSTWVDEGRGNYPPSQWLSDEGFTPPVLSDSGESEAFQAFGGTGFPYVLYVDADNKVVSRSAGLPADEIVERWEQAVAG